MAGLQQRQRHVLLLGFESLRYCVAVVGGAPMGVCMMRGHVTCGIRPQPWLVLLCTCRGTGEPSPNRWKELAVPPLRSVHIKGHEGWGLRELCMSWISVCRVSSLEKRDDVTCGCCWGEIGCAVWHRVEHLKTQAQQKSLVSAKAIIGAATCGGLPKPPRAALFFFWLRPR